MTFLYITCAVCAVCAGSIIIHTIINGTPPMPSSVKARKRIIGAIRDIDGGKNIYELGSGWGTIAFTLSKEFPEKRIKAFENSPVPFIFTKLRKMIRPCKNLKIQRADIFGISLSEADVIVCYLHSGAMERLREKFDRELEKGALVISNTFAIPGWRPAGVLELGDIYRTKIYTYCKEFFG